MADRVVPGPVEGSARIREAVCIRTRKIFDSIQIIENADIIGAN